MAMPSYVLLYDRDCGICSAFSRWIHIVDVRGRIRFQSIQSGRALLKGVHEESERLFPELPLPDILVAVEIRSEVPHRIVQVKRADSPEAHRLVDGPEERLVAVPDSEVVARRERMAGVDADPEAVRMGGTFHHVGELLEPVSDDGPRTRRVLQDRKYVRGARMLETPIQTPRDRLDRVRLALPHVGSRMEYHVQDPEELSPVELLPD